MLPPSIYKPKKFYAEPRTNPFITNVDFIFDNSTKTLPDLPRQSQSTKNVTSPRSDLTNRFMVNTESKVLHTAPGEDPEVIHEYPYKDTIILRQLHIKLKKLFGDQEPKPYEFTERAQRELSNKEIDMDDYLNYLKKIVGPDEFKQKLRDKDREIQAQEKMNQALALGLRFDQQLPTHLKKLVRPDLVESPMEKRYRRNANTHWTGFSTNKVLRPHLLEDKKPQVRRFSKQLIGSFIDGSLENIDVDPADYAKIKNLAKDIIVNFKIFNETTVNNKDVLREVKVELDKERVADMFFGRVQKNLGKLEREIISAMILTKLSNEPDSPLKKNKNIPKLGIQPNKVALFERVNHYLLEANAKFTVSIFKGLEKDIAKVHDEMAFKSKALKEKLQFWDRKRLAIISNDPLFNTPNLPGHLEILSPGEEIRKFEAVHGEMKAIPNEKKFLADEIQESVLRIRQKLSSP